MRDGTLKAALAFQSPRTAFYFSGRRDAVLRIEVAVEPQPDGTYVARAVGLPRCVATGRTPKEALVRVRMTVQDALQGVGAGSGSGGCPGCAG